MGSHGQLGNIGRLIAGWLMDEKIMKTNYRRKLYSSDSIGVSVPNTRTVQFITNKRFRPTVPVTEAGTGVSTGNSSKGEQAGMWGDNCARVTGGGNRTFQNIQHQAESLNKMKERPFEYHSTHMFEDREYRKKTQVLFSTI